MNSALFIAIAAGFSGMLGWGFADFFAKKTIDEVGDVVSLVWAHIFGTALIAIFALYSVLAFKYPLHIPTSPVIWLGLFFFGTLQAIVYLLAYQGFSKGQVALLNPVFASFPGLTAVLSILIFGEVINNHLVVALITIFLGILLLNIDFTALKTRKIRLSKINGLKEILFAAFFAAFWTLFWGKFVQNNDWLSYAFFMYASMTVVVFIIAKARKINLSVKKTYVWKFLILIGFCETIAYIGLSIGYSKTSLISIIAVVSGAFSLPTIMLARGFLKEKVSVMQTIGSIIIIAGIIFLSIQ